MSGKRGPKKGSGGAPSLLQKQANSNGDGEGDGNVNGNGEGAKATATAQSTATVRKRTWRQTQLLWMQTAVVADFQQTSLLGCQIG
jgi:hypothetical protein